LDRTAELARPLDMGGIMRTFARKPTVICSGLVAALLLTCGGLAVTDTAHAGAIASGLRAAAQGARNAASTAARAGSRLPDGSLRLPRVVSRPRVIEPIVVPPSAVASFPDLVFDRSVQLIRPHVEDLSQTDARAVLATACTFNDAAEVLSQENFNAAVSTALISFGGRRTLVHRVAGLSDDLAAAESTSDQVQKAAVALLCEVA
jgi:hypothetical protein